VVKAPQVVRVDEVLVAERDAEHALADQRRHIGGDPPRRPAVAEAGGEAIHQTDSPVGGAEQQRACVRRDRAAAEIRHHVAPIDPCKGQRLQATLCRHRGLPVTWCKCLFALILYQSAATMRQPYVRDAG
jgi:hypothetical protein